MNVYLDAALNLAQLGYAVFPCVPREKFPIPRRGFHEATRDVEKIREWWAASPTANVAVSAEGLLVVDVDGENNPWPGEERARDLLAARAIARTPRGGRHYVFRLASPDWRCSAGTLGAGVDVRTTGGYFLVAPSKTAHGVYRWLEGKALDVPIDQLTLPPAWLTPPTATKTLAQNLATETSPLPSISEGKRNDTLTRIAGSMRRFGMSRPEILAALLETNRARCSPPLSEREVEKIASSVSRYAPDEIAVALVEGTTVHIEHEAHEKESEENSEGEENRVSEIPSELLRVPGFVGEVVDYTLATAPYPEPVIALAGALSLLAVLAGRKVRDEIENRTNLYVLALANSGVGKDHARKVNARVLHGAGLSDCLGTSFASGEGIEDWLFAQPATLFQVDEIDGLLLRVGHARDARHEAIVSTLLQFYSTAASVYVLRARAGRERAVIEQPCLGIFGTAIPKNFYESMTERLLTNGFLARFLVLESGPRGKGQDVPRLALPSRILEAARWWAEVPTSVPVEPRTVEATAEAQEAFREARAAADAEYANHERAGNASGMALWARSYEKVRRLALLYAVSEEPRNSRINASAARWASRLVEFATRRTLAMASRFAHEGEFDAKRKRVLEILSFWRAKNGSEWMPFWKLARRCPWPKKDHDAVREVLVEERRVEVTVTRAPGSGRVGFLYRITP